MYCWDTDTLSGALRSPPLDLIRKMTGVAPTEQCTTSITLGELLYGAARRQSSKLTQRIESLLRTGLWVFPFDRAASEVFGTLKADLERSGKPLSEPDLRIASICLSRDLTLITGNVRHFSRVPELRIENWLEG